jgi:hypothetical protein
MFMLVAVSGVFCMKFKSLTAIAIVCVGIGAYAQIAKDNIVGYEKVEIPGAGGVNLVGFNFGGAALPSLEDVFGDDQLTQTTGNPLNADRLYIWNGSSYDSYFQKTDGFFYDVMGETQKTAQVTAGTAIFIKSPGTAPSKFILLSGAVLTSAAEGGSYDGLRAFANPYATDLDLNNADLDWSAATSTSSEYLPALADNIFIWNPATSEYDLHYLQSDGKWYAWPSRVQGAVLPAGVGAFYRARQAFTNSIVRPFTP